MIKEELNIVIVCGTRKSENDFYEKTATGRSLKSTSEITKNKIILYPENTKGLSEIYNDAIQITKNEESILVFMHDDIWITDFFYKVRIQKALEKFDIAGVVGCIARTKKQPSWCHMYYNPESQKFIQHNISNLSGSIGHGKTYPEKIDYFGPTMKECNLVDGVIIAVKSKKLIETNTYFDNQFKFHFYDLDFCRTAERNKLKIGTMDVSIIHESYGGFQTEEWREAYNKYMSKWKE